MLHANKQLWACLLTAILCSNPCLAGDLCDFGGVRAKSVSAILARLPFVLNLFISLLNVGGLAAEQQPLIQSRAKQP